MGEGQGEGQGEGAVRNRITAACNDKEIPWIIVGQVCPTDSPPE